MADNLDIKFRVLLETNQAKTGLDEVKKKSDEVSTSIQKVGNSSGQTGSVMMGMNNVIRDSRYGFIGVYNNITQVMDGFGYLKKSAGGTMEALKMLGSSIMGMGGVMLAFNLLIAYYPEIVAFFSGTTAVSKEAVKAMNEYKQQIESIVASMVELKAETENIKVQFTMEGIHKALGTTNEFIQNARVEIGAYNKQKSQAIKESQEALLSGASVSATKEKLNMKLAEIDLEIRLRQETINTLEAEAKYFDKIKKEEELRLKVYADLKNAGGTVKVKDKKYGKTPNIQDPSDAFELTKFIDYSRTTKEIWDDIGDKIQSAENRFQYKDYQEKANAEMQAWLEVEEKRIIREREQNINKINNLREAWLGLGDTMANTFSQMGGDLNKVGSTMQKIMAVMRIIQQMQASQDMYKSGDISKEGNIINQITGFLGAFGTGVSKSVQNGSNSTTVNVNMGNETVNKVMINNSRQINNRKVQLGVA